MRILKRLVLTLSCLLLLFILSIPLLSFFTVDMKYERFAGFHPLSDEYYEADLPGAQPRRACGGTAGQYNWGEQHRRYLSLNGMWDIAEGKLDDSAPAVYSHKVPVPGLVTAAEPSFADVGLVSDQREAFWHRRVFSAPTEKSDTALLCIAKAKYGIRVWLNGELMGEHFGAFTQAEFDLAQQIKWGDHNELVVRVGAERSQVSPAIPVGNDHEKTHWMPGLWDDVNLVLSGAQTIVRSKIETDLNSGSTTIITTVHNAGADAVDVQLQHQIKEWRTQETRAQQQGDTFKLEGGESRSIEESIAVESPILWTLGRPFLYVAHTQLVANGSISDDRANRFGYRHVEWRGGDDKGFYLNGQKELLRGSNISLHRYFEEPLAGSLTWNEAWVRKLFSSYPREYQWNILRTSLGRVPNFWYDIADEEGLLIDDEFAYWSLHFPPPPPKENGEQGEKKDNDRDETYLDWSIVEMEKEFTSWIQENWNHPSIAFWSASNETADIKSTQVIDRVRQLDTTRQWENGGWQLPHAANDPVEDHPYIFAANFNPVSEALGLSAKGIEALDGRDGQPKSAFNPMTLTYPSFEHPHFINEYGWLWLNRDGTPTKLTANVYEMLLGDKATQDTRREAYAYLHAGLTGFWRAKRGYQGVQHFSYLSHSKPGIGFTSDNFSDLETLQMEPRWHEYHKNVWSPVSVYIDQWTDDYGRGQRESVPLIVINDLNKSTKAQLQLYLLSAQGDTLSKSKTESFTLNALEQKELSVSIDVPAQDQLILFARLSYGEQLEHTMLDRRKLGVAHVGVRMPDLFEDKQ